MKTFEFTEKCGREIYTWTADTLEEAIEEICDGFDIDPDDIDEIWELTIETMRERIKNHIEDGQTSDSYSIGRARLDWVPGRMEYLLTMPDGETIWEAGGCGDSIDYIDDQDIVDFYHKEISESYLENSGSIYWEGR